MPRFIIERRIAGAGDWTDEEVEQVSSKSNAILADMPDVEWEQSYVSDNRLYCVYSAPDAESVLEHARRGGFPADNVSEVRRNIGPFNGDRSGA